MTDQDVIHEQWPDLQERLKTTWGRLSNEDLAHENGNRDYVIAKVQQHYGYSKELAEQLVRDFERSL